MQEIVHAHMFSCVDKALGFILAGNARITLVSKKTEVRYSYRIRKAPDSNGKVVPHFVSVLTGSNNEVDYSYLGVIFQGNKYVHGSKSRIGRGAGSAMAFDWAWWMMQRNGVIPSTIEIWHEGRCGRCARTLTVPESIELGLGPECAQKAA